MQLLAPIWHKAAKTTSNKLLGLGMKALTKKIAVLYGAWALLWVSIALYGALFTYHGEFGISAHLWLTLTGLPSSFVSWAIHPHGTVLGGIVAGVAGLLQWSAIAEISARSNARKIGRDNEI